MKRISFIKGAVAASVVIGLSGCANNSIKDFGEVQNDSFEKNVDDGLASAKEVWGSHYEPITYSLRTEELFAKKENKVPHHMIITNFRQSNETVGQYKNIKKDPIPLISIL